MHMHAGTVQIYVCDALKDLEFIINSQVWLGEEVILHP